MKLGNAPRRWGAAVVTSAAVLLACGHAAQAQTLAEMSPGAEAKLQLLGNLSDSERAAIDVMLAWNDGWDKRSTALVAGTMTPDAYWAGGFPTNPNRGIWRSADRYVQQDGRATTGGVLFTIDEVLAVGGSQGTAILYRRPDEFGFGDYMTMGPSDGIGTYFVNATLKWVVDDKIDIWLDMPVLFPPVPRNAAPPISSSAETEAAALAVVESWVAGWNAKDPQAVASLMTDNVQFSTMYPEHITETSSAHFLASRSEDITGGVEMTIGDTLAVGGPLGTGVLIERTDKFTVDGQSYEVPTAAFFWVVDGKIDTWLDFPIETPPDDASGNPIVR